MAAWSPLKGRPGGGPRRWLLAVAVAAVAAPSPAAAEEQPAILKAYGLDWIERVREEAWPQPYDERPVVCLLDTGVAVTPDTPETSRDGPIVARLSVEDPVGDADGGGPATVDPALGRPQGESWVHQHGTRMAGIIAAPRNGWGTVGIFPRAKIVSVRVTRGQETFIEPGDIEGGIRFCIRWARQSRVGIAAVVVAESLYDQRVQDVQVWETGAAYAKAAGGVVVAAMGNSQQAELVAPLAAKSVIAVGAGTDTGAPCADVPRSPGQIIGPGCSKLQPAWHEGSSSATAATGALVAALATRYPGDSADQRRQRLVAATEVEASGWAKLAGGRVQSAFGGLVSELASQPAPLESATVVAKDRGGEDAAGADASPQLRLWRPGVKARWIKGKLHVTRTQFHSRGVLRIRLGSAASSLRMAGRRRSFKSNRRPRSIEVWAESSDQVTWRSLSRRARVGS